MQRITLTSDLNISRLVYGLWRILDDPLHSAAHLQAKMETCLKIGLTTFDQADIYGCYATEEAMGETLRAAPHLRNRIEIITKCGIIAPMGRYSEHRVKHYNTSAHHITQSVESSLRLMSIEQIDVLLIHRPDPFMDAEQTGRALDKLIEEGKVRAIGVSNFKPHDIELLSSMMHNPLVTNQIEISLSHSEAFTNGDMAYLQQYKTLPMAWSPLGGGSLFQSQNKGLLNRLSELAEHYDVDVATIAIAWLLAHPAGIIPVLGTNSLQRIKNMGKAVDVKLDRETWFELYSLAKGHEVT